MKFIYNLCDKIVKGVPIYNNFKILPILNSGIKNNIDILRHEFNYTLLKGSGILVVKDIIDSETINNTNDLINEITYKQIMPKNDHFSNVFYVFLGPFSILFIALCCLPCCVAGGAAHMQTS